MAALQILLKYPAAKEKFLANWHYWQWDFCIRSKQDFYPTWELTLTKEVM